MVSGVGLISSSASAKASAMALLDELRHERRDHDRGVHRLVVERERHLGEREDLHLHVGDRQPDGFQHLAGLVGRDRAGAVAGDDLALQRAQVLHAVLQVRAQHQIMADRRGDAVGHDGDREILLQRVEIAGRDAARDHVEAALRQQRDRIGRGVEQLDLDLDVVLLEVALLDRDQLRAVRHRARDADAHGLLLRGQRASARAARRLETGAASVPPGVFD